jgi:hypothetical protein
MQVTCFIQLLHQSLAEALSGRIRFTHVSLGSLRLALFWKRVWCEIKGAQLLAVNSKLFSLFHDSHDYRPIADCDEYSEIIMCAVLFLLYTTVLFEWHLRKPFNAIKGLYGATSRTLQAIEA